MLSASDLLYGARAATRSSRDVSPTSAPSLLLRARLELRNRLSQIIGFGGILQEECKAQALDRHALSLGHMVEAAHVLLIHINEKLDPYRINRYRTGEINTEIKVFVSQTLASVQRLAALEEARLSATFHEDTTNLRQAVEQVGAITEGLLADLDALPERDFLPVMTDDNRRVSLQDIPKRSSAQTQGNDTHTGRILIVDDSPLNLAMLKRILGQDGYAIVVAEHGDEAMRLLNESDIDVVLLDVLPDAGGADLLRTIKRTERFREIRVIMLSASDKIETVAECIDAGAEDYLLKPINPVLLMARVRECLERKALRDKQRKTFDELVRSQRRLDRELAEAAAYVTSLLPREVTSPHIQARWRFIPSRHLGGDAFGYEWVDDDHFGFYLLDVSGHGIRAALLSISVMNLLRSGSLQATDYRDPSHVLTTLNRAFQMEWQHNLYFSIWYGVYNRRKRELTYANAGHPPALLFLAGITPCEPLRLSSHGPIIGAVPGLEYKSSDQLIPPGSQLFLFSDGAYEVRQRDGQFWDFENYVEALQTRCEKGGDFDFDDLLESTRQLQGGHSFIDDYSLLNLRFD